MRCRRVSCTRFRPSWRVLVGTTSRPTASRDWWPARSGPAWDPGDVPNSKPSRPAKIPRTQNPTTSLIFRSQKWVLKFLTPWFKTVVNRAFFELSEFLLILQMLTPKHNSFIATIAKLQYCNYIPPIYLHTYRPRKLWLFIATRAQCALEGWENWWLTREKRLSTFT